MQEAYDERILTKNELMQVADNINNGLNSSDILDSSVEKKIKIDMANAMRLDNVNPIKEATADDVYVVSYYGKYSDSHVIILGNNYVDYPAEPISYTIEIGGVYINVTRYEPIIVWIQK